LNKNIKGQVIIWNICFFIKCVTTKYLKLCIYHLVTLKYYLSLKSLGKYKKYECLYSPVLNIILFSIQTLVTHRN